MESTNYTYRGIDYVVLHEKGQGYNGICVLKGNKITANSSTRDQVKNMIKKRIKKAGY